MLPVILVVLWLALVFGGHGELSPFVLLLFLLSPVTARPSRRIANGSEEE